MRDRSRHLGFLHGAMLAASRRINTTGSVDGCIHLPGLGSSMPTPSTARKGKARMPVGLHVDRRINEKTDSAGSG